MALLDGFQVDDGTAWELGYASARGVAVLGLRTDFGRAADACVTPVKLMLHKCCRQLFTRTDELLLWLQTNHASSATIRKSGDALGEIVHLVENTSDQVRAIATASEQQSATSEEINRSIEDVSSISAETAQTMTQAAQAVVELAGQTAELKELIDEMQADGQLDYASRPLPAGRGALALA